MLRPDDKKIVQAWQNAAPSLQCVQGRFRERKDAASFVFICPGGGRWSEGQSVAWNGEWEVSRASTFWFPRGGDWATPPAGCMLAGCLLAACWLSAGHLLAPCWLPAGCLLAAYWLACCPLAVCWLSAGCLMAVCWQLVGWLLAVCWLPAAGCWLAATCLLAGCWLPAG